MRVRSLLALISSLLIVFAHRENVGRLISGTEWFQ